MQIHVAKNGQQTGPFDEAQIREKLSQGEFAPTDLAWHADLAGWQPLSTLFPDAAGSSVTPPPAPEPTPPPAPAYTPSVYSPPAPAQSALGAGGYMPLPVAGAPGQLPPPQFYNPVGMADPNLASLGARFGAAMVDLLIGVVAGLPGNLLMRGGISMNDEGTPVLNSMYWVGLAISVVLGFGVLGVQIYLLSTQGQSIGKKVLGIRIVRLDGGQAGFVGAFLMRSFVSGLLSITCIYPLVDICFIFRADRRCIHDLIASTKVVRA